MRKLFIGGNWKCNSMLGQTQQIITNVVDKLAFDNEKVDVVVAPVFLHLVTVQFTKKQPNVEVAAQNCSGHGFGAFTGEIAAQHLRDINIKWVILGHSERRTVFGETDELIAKKVTEALKYGLHVILCFGESEAERDQKQTTTVIKKQLDAVKSSITDWNRVVLAYEPIWAIGTGKTATTDQVAEVHTFIREYLSAIQGTQKTRVIYGGSVNEKNCVELIKVKEVDGFLVGGASLKESFIHIVNSTQHK